MAKGKEKTSFLKEFREFAVKGNMLDMAVGIIIGTAFNNVVNTMVKKVIMPPLSVMTDDVHISDRKYVLRSASEGVEEIAIEYGEMIEVLIDFLIIAFTVFIFVKFFNTLREKAYQTRIKIETDKLKEALGEVVSSDSDREKDDSEPDPEPEPTEALEVAPVVEEKKSSDETLLLEKIEKLLQEQNKILQNKK